MWARQAAVVAGALLLAAAAPPELPETAAHWLAAYAAGDWQTVHSMLSARELYVYGSEPNEYAEGRRAFLRLFDLEQKLWAGGHPAFGPLSDVSGVGSGPVETLFFNTPFTLHGRTEVMRFATVWRLEYGVWKLMQSSHTVPSTGSGAADLVRR